VRLDPELYIRLKSYGVSYRPRKTNQEMIVEAIKAYLAQAKE
jgi:predicted DNA-binding protein